MGIRAISGVPFLPLNTWVDFKRINQQLTNPKTLDKAREAYQTIIFDEVFASARMCQDYVCQMNGATHMGEVAPQGEVRPNLWTAYQAEYYTEINKLLKSGFTIVFIGHETRDKETNQIIPKGDVRSMELVRDHADITIYLAGNGVDENNKVIKSSAYLAATPDYFARSRYDYMDTYIPEFTAEALEEVVAEAVRREEEATGNKTVSFAEHLESVTTAEINLDDLKAEVNEVGALLAEEHLDELLEVISRHLGKGAIVDNVKISQVNELAVVALELKDLAIKYNVI